ncbi:shikimate dehydrogenase [Corynebacterium sp. TAE3-ERU12]|uniref:shikimate dehydrogenase n=1 Tax=Corynebacterium sp. TAE3-ERU12 TaxID=2849491 RepID=UPI001C4698DA|nr:shikimate dehydrogenase [Corynebacterium sp. TAE3-ERU12]MBV7295375.1 shikimate dehydrogenase [Corynebacterium sp. TAE3-ERU12]
MSLPDTDQYRHLAAVMGDPVAHSKSPALHNAGYAALGLADWHYLPIQCNAEQLADVVGGADERFAGFSVTMPGKFAALDYADEVSDRARAIGSANTLVRLDGNRWRADNTDCEGVSGALRELGLSEARRGRGIIVGNGGTARPAMWALHQLGVRHVNIVARSERAYDLAPLAAQLGMEFTWVRLDAPNLADIAAAADVLVSTVPAAAVEGVAGQLARAPMILDAIYDPWPTPLVSAARRVDTPAVGGLTMLLHQALSQFEQFTGHTAPREAMRAAIMD